MAASFDPRSVSKGPGDAVWLDEARGPLNEALTVAPDAMISTPSLLMAGPPVSIVDRLQRYAAQVEGALAPNTIRSFRADMRVFVAWADAEGCAGDPVGLPVRPDQVVRFIEATAADRAPATVRHYVSSIATLHQAAGAPDPTTSPDVRLALKRMHRSRGRAQKQAAGLGREHVTRMLAAVPRDTMIGIRDRALLSVAYDTLARRSELAAMDLDDVQIDGDGSGTILIRRSKSDQEGQGSVRFIAPDTVGHLQAWIRAGMIERAMLVLDTTGKPVIDRTGQRQTHRPLFRSVRNGIIGVAIDPKDVARRFKAMAEAARLPAEMVRAISAHSTRVGAAQDMVRAGLALPAVMQSGGWKNPEMVGRYTRRLEAKRGGAAQLAALQKRGAGKPSR